MKGQLRPRRPSPALVVAIIALVMASAGTGYAATKLPRNSVGTQQLKKNAVTSAKVKNGSIAPADLSATTRAALTGPAGPKGDAGSPGAKGDKGDKGDSATRLFATVKDDGTLVSGGGGPVVTRTAAGTYEVLFSQEVAACAAVVTQGGVPSGTPGGNTGSARGPARAFTSTPGFTQPSGNPIGRTVIVETNSGSPPTPTDSSFHLIVVC